MKKCNECSNVYPESEFYTNGVYIKTDGSTTQRYKPKCKSCEMLCTKDRYRSLVQEYYGVHKCSSCGYDKCLEAIELHHIDPEIKDRDPSSLKNLSKARIFEEFSKCVLLCATCHREVHYGYLDL